MQPFTHCNMTPVDFFNFLIYFYFMYSVFVCLCTCVYTIYSEQEGQEGWRTPRDRVINTKEIQMVVSCHVGVWDLNMGLLEK